MINLKNLRLQEKIKSKLHRKKIRKPFKMKNFLINHSDQQVNSLK